MTNNNENKKQADKLLAEIADIQHTNAELAFQKNEELLILLKENDYYLGYGLALNNKGNYFFWRDEPEKAIEYYIEADKILSKSDNWEDRIIAKTNLAMVFIKINEAEKCLKIYREVESDLENQELGLRHAQVYLNMDAALFGLDKINESLYYAEKGYQIVNQLNHPFGKRLAANHLSGCFLKLNQIDKAEHYINECFNLEKQHSFPQQNAMDNYRAAQIQNKKGNFNLATQHCRLALAALENSQNIEIKIGVLDTLAESFEKMNDFKNALHSTKQLLKEKEIFLSNEKTNVIAGLNRKYDIERKDAQLKEIKLHQLDAELKAIKSQMNPHFVFNVLSTTDHLIEKGQNEKARTSLRTFAKLMRAILQQSQEEFTLIEDEIILLQNYIELEKLSVGDSLSYSIQVDENIDSSYEKIPAMLLQPIVENAVKHGLRHKSGEKKLNVLFRLQDNFLKIEIEDNGIGREASAELNKYRKNHQSFAGSAIENRIKFLNEMSGKEKYKIEVLDLNIGTKVSISIHQD